MSSIIRASLPVLLLVAAACSPESGPLDPALEPGDASRSSVAALDAWCPPVNLGPIVNSSLGDNSPALSNDGLVLYFTSLRGGAVDIWLTERATIDDPWTAPVSVVALNSPWIDTGVHITRDGHWLHLASDRPSPYPETGSLDIWVSHREDVRDPLGWGEPVNLGPTVNGLQAEVGPSVWGPELYFSRGVGAGTPPLPPGVPSIPLDLYVSTSRGGMFLAPEELSHLNSPAIDQRATIRFDGREMLYSSTRDGGEGLDDIYVATRAGNGLAWSPPTTVSELSTAARDLQPSLSSDGRTLVFVSDRAGGSGGLDIWMSLRRPAGACGQ